MGANPEKIIFDFFPGVDKASRSREKVSSGS